MPVTDMPCIGANPGDPGQSSCLHSSPEAAVLLTRRGKEPSVQQALEMAADCSSI